MKVIPVSALCLLASSFFVHAELNVVADLGGKDTASFFDGINRQDNNESNNTENRTWQGQPGEGAMLPVLTPELTVGIEASRALSLPGIGALFLVGDDPASRSWLQMNAAKLSQMQAVGLIVNVMDMAAVQALRSLVPGVQMAPASGSELARRLRLQHYPTLITETSVSSEVR
ncbi:MULTISPECIES: integrating conjugative element protein [Pectobacterium]|uniref:Integrating conjugative element protein n=1 Tax=Pectobacterium aquaticum TaxID=2204145 RepID=A0AA93AJ26_9GAMM|nr:MULTISPECIES: integrating conjugative element protein [Pectobacterium]AZK61334.1 integrating conjugative element protein [Pectobacterium versatile]MBE5221334.1 integrating conjugative element protein [Pectobacterium quasiaquaticum]RRN95045.1 integrating conjugative element protein [Pectobacterium aquaticum]RRO03604.1 integrating conjugative element protein [Pectobacterium aquaticum]RRO13488.1 integrating conjugative element protein [Pectobacterium aquaticum]